MQRSVDNQLASARLAPGPTGAARHHPAGQGADSAPRFYLRPPTRGQIGRYARRTIVRHRPLSAPADGFDPAARHNPMRVVQEDAAAQAAQLPGLGGATVLVTDASGMLGVYLHAILEAAGARVVTPERHGNVLLLPPDTVDHVIHMGPPAHPGAVPRDPVGTLAAGTSALALLLDHAQTHGAHLTFVSMCDVLHQLNPLDVRSCYQMATLAGEALCVAYRAQHGVASSIVRLAHVYGPGFDTDGSQTWVRLVRNAADGETVVVHSNDQRRLPWTYVADAADAVLRTALTGAERATTVAFDASDERSRCNIRAFARAALHSVGRPPAVAFQLNTPDPTLTMAAQPTLPATRPPGWKPRTHLSDGLDRTVRWYRDVRSAVLLEAAVDG